MVGRNESVPACVFFTKTGTRGKSTRPHFIKGLFQEKDLDLRIVTITINLRLGKFTLIFFNLLCSPVMVSGYVDSFHLNIHLCNFCQCNIFLSFICAPHSISNFTFKTLTATCLPQK